MTNEINAITISTIIPFFNGSKYIERALASIVEQTLPSTEIIVVDDGSRPVEYDYLRQLQAKYKFNLFRKDNGGQGSARNFGAARSTADFIAFLDQDDYYLPQHNEILYSEVDRTDKRFGWVYGDLWHADGDGMVVSLSILDGTDCEHPKRNIREMLGSDLFILPSASLLSKVAFTDVGGFDEQFRGYEDDDLFIRMFRRGWTNKFIRKPVTVWCINKESTSYSVRMAVSRLRYFKKLLKDFPDSSFNSCYYTRDLLIPRFLRMTLSQAIAYCSSPDRDIDVYIEVMIEFQEIINRYESVCWDDKRQILDVIHHLSRHREGDALRQSIAVAGLSRSYDDGGVDLYKPIFIGGRMVRFIDFDLLRRRRKEKNDPEYAAGTP